MKGNVNPEYVTEVRKLIGDWFRQMREAKEMSQLELAEKMGIDQRTVSKVENGVWNFGIDTIILFAVHLDFYPFFLPKDSKDPLAKQMRERWKRSQDEQ